MSNLLSLNEIRNLLLEREATSDPLKLPRRLATIVNKGIVSCVSVDDWISQQFSVEQVRAMTIYIRLMEIGILSLAAKQQMGEQIQSVARDSLPRQVGFLALGKDAEVSVGLNGMEGY